VRPCPPLLLLSLVLGQAAPGLAQSPRPDKLDSFLVALPVSKAEAGDRVVAAFVAAGLPVTNTTPSLIESDQGSTHDGLGSYSRHRVVRATLLAAGGDTTRVLIQGTEDLVRGGQMEKRKAIDNRAGGNGGKVWARMRVAATALDPTQLPPDVPKNAEKE
jgi:hypothetical protein